MRRFALVLIPALLLACSEESTGPVDGLSGTFDFGFDFVLVTELPSDWLGEPGDANAFDPTAVQLACEGDGDATLVAYGSTFSGAFNQVGSCETPDGPRPSVGFGAVENGLVDGSRVQFEVRPCVFDGDLYRDGGGGAAGTVSCVVNHPRIRLIYQGTWSMTPP